MDRQNYRRMKARRTAVMAKGYSEAGASLHRRALKSFVPNSGSPTEDINENLFTLRQRGRMLVQAAPVAASAVNTHRTKVVGTGLSLKSTIDADILGMSPEAKKAWQHKTEAEFALWFGKKQNCDALGLNNGYELQQIAYKNARTSGDVFALIKQYPVTKMQPYSMRLQLVEADRVSTPDNCAGIRVVPGRTEGVNQENGNAIHDGVEVDRNGKVVAYHICNVYPFQITNEPKVWTRVLAVGENTGLPNILHVMVAERPDQYRGVTMLASVIEPMLQLRRYTESELMAALVQSFFTAWIETESDPSDLPVNEVGASDIDGVPTESPDGMSSSENEYELGPGTVNVLAPGEKVQFGNPNIPTAGFDTFVKVVAKQCGAALGIPYDVLMKEFNASYSASRAALLEAWEEFKMYRAWFVSDFCQPIYEAWLSEAVARGRIKAPGFFDDPLIHDAWCAASWIGPVQGSIDPRKEAEADLMLIKAGIKTHEQVTREKTGGDWAENVAQLKAENELLAKAGGVQEPEPEQSTTDEPDEEPDDGGNQNNE